MILRRSEFMALANLDENTLEMWLSEEWLLPARDAQEEAYSEADVARARLIHELRRDFGINDAGVGVALHLLDQIHGLRAVLHHKASPAKRR